MRVLLLGWQPDVTEDYTYETAGSEAFLLPKGVGVELYATTLHYAPCSVGDNADFRVASYFRAIPTFRLIQHMKAGRMSI